ncbi:MAG: hypothetical protein OXT09_09955 [Myxococcales bacterium]|nr:hypothetical protein [Myxococcales bacterium]
MKLYTRILVTMVSLAAAASASAQPTEVPAAPEAPVAEPSAAAPVAAEASPGAPPAPAPAPVTEAPPSPGPAPEAAAVAEAAPAPPEAPAPTGEGDDGGDGGGALQIKVYGDANFSFDDQDGTDPTFSIGDVQLDAGGAISDSVRMVTSTLLQLEGNDADVELDIALLEWDVDDGFGLRLGRNRAMTGRYYRATPSRLAELATSSPVLASDEDDGGVLLAHQLGLEVFGGTSTEGGLGLHYALGISNGRGHSTRAPSGNLDSNDFKAISVRLAALPGPEGLELGVSGYADRIPAGLRDADGTVLIGEEIDELVGAVHLAYITDSVDLQGELYYLYHEGRDSKADAQLVGGFLQAGVPVERFTPYGRLELMDRDVNDLFFNVSGIPFQVTDLRIGVGYRIADGAVLKLEYGGELETEVHGGTAQIAFGL